MLSKGWRIPITILLTLLGFLLSFVLVDIYEITYGPLATRLHLLRSCDCEEACSESTPSRYTSNGSEALDDVPLRKFYDEVMKTGIGRMGGDKMDITLLSAFEHPDQIYVMMTSRAKYGDTIYCRYFNHKRKEIGSAFKTTVFPEFTANCLRRKGAEYISLSDSPNGSYEFPVPIIDRTQNVTSHYLSACLAPIYGTAPKWLLLAEYMEHHKIQGVTHFFIYIKEVDEYTRRLVDDYVRTGEAEVIILRDRFVRGNRLWQVVQVQECLIRARGHSQWVTMMDLDERLITTKFSGTLVDYLRSISDPTIAEISLRQQWLPTNDTPPEKYINKSQIAELMPTSKYHNTSRVAAPGDTAKYIIDPKKTVIANIHAIEKFFDGYRRYYVKPEEAVVRHYRDIYADNWGNIWLKDLEKLGKFSMTDYPKQHMDTLRENVQQRLHHVYGGMS